MPLSNYEQETIINFNKDEKVAYIFTYEKSWQKHIEQRFKIKATYNNGFGGKEYILPKDRIKMPYPKKRGVVSNLPSVVKASPVSKSRKAKVV